MTTTKLLLLLVATLVLAVLPSNPGVQAFAGIAAGRGKFSCEKEGSACYTQGACCEDYSCVRLGNAWYGRCTANRADMRLAGGGSGGASATTDAAAGASSAVWFADATDCASDLDCPASQCCRPVGMETAAAAAAAAPAAPAGSRKTCRGGSHCGGHSMESMFNQYYSALMRKRFGG